MRTPGGTGALRRSSGRPLKRLGSGPHRNDQGLSRAALTAHELEWLEPWGKLAELELKCSNRELVYVLNTNVTLST